MWLRKLGLHRPTCPWSGRRRRTQNSVNLRNMGLLKTLPDVQGVYRDFMAWATGTCTSVCSYGPLLISNSAHHILCAAPQYYSNYNQRDGEIKTWCRIDEVQSALSMVKEQSPRLRAVLRQTKTEYWL